MATSSKNLSNEFFIETNKDNLNYLTHQFNSFSVSNYSENSSNDLKAFFGRMIHQLQKFEGQIDEKLQNYVQNMKESKPPTEVVKFPQLSIKKPVSQSSVLDEFIRNHPSQNLDFESSFLYMHSIPKPEKTKPSSQNEKRTDIRKRKIETIYHPIKILSKEARNDPFCDLPPLSEPEAQQGLANLINNGVIPREIDLAPAFERNPPLKTFLLKLTLFLK